MNLFKVVLNAWGIWVPLALTAAFFGILALLDTP